jgi:hypothetical protein
MKHCIAALNKVADHERVGNIAEPDFEAAAQSLWHCLQVTPSPTAVIAHKRSYKMARLQEQLCHVAANKPPGAGDQQFHI